MVIQLEYALDEVNTVTSIYTASKNKRYYCPVPSCAGELIVKKGDIRAHHFAHKNIKINHKPETILHHNTKILLFKYLQHFISEKRSLNISFRCSCENIHNINILKKVDEIRCEKEIKDGYRPDLTLLNNNKPILYVEIIVTHDVDKNNYQIIGNTPLIKIKPTEGIYNDLNEKFNKLDDNLYNFQNTDKHMSLKNIYGFQYCDSYGACKMQDDGCNECEFFHIDDTSFKMHSCNLKIRAKELLQEVKGENKQLKKLINQQIKKKIAYEKEQFRKEQYPANKHNFFPKKKQMYDFTW